jgi:hypothetical protein
MLVPAAVVGARCGQRRAQGRAWARGAPLSGPRTRRPSKEGEGRLGRPRCGWAGRSRPHLKGARPGILVSGPGEGRAGSVPLSMTGAAEGEAGPAASASAAGALAKGSAATGAHAKGSAAAAAVPPTTALAPFGKDAEGRGRWPLLLLGWRLGRRGGLV